MTTSYFKETDDIGKKFVITNHDDQVNHGKQGVVVNIKYKEDMTFLYRVILEDGENYLLDPNPKYFKFL